MAGKARSFTGLKKCFHGVIGFLPSIELLGFVASGDVHFYDANPAKNMAAMMVVFSHDLDLVLKDWIIENRFMDLIAI